jgi:hypothetical protein
MVAFRGQIKSVLQTKNMLEDLDCPDIDEKERESAYNFFQAGVVPRCLSVLFDYTNSRMWTVPRDLL